MHASLHRDGRWHTKINRGQSYPPAYLNYRRPDPVGPGCTRALHISAHWSWASLGDSVTNRNLLWCVPPPGNNRICFDVFLLDAGVDEVIWPERGESTRLVGDVELALGGRAVVLATAVQHDEQKFQLPHQYTPEELDEIRKRIREAGHAPRMIIFGDTRDGAIAMLFGQMALVEVAPV